MQIAENDQNNFMQIIFIQMIQLWEKEEFGQCIAQNSKHPKMESGKSSLNFILRQTL